MDTYTKIVLTVIAVALSVIAIQNAGIGQPAVAQAVRPAKVTICSEDGTACARVTQGDLHTN